MLRYLLQCDFQSFAPMAFGVMLHHLIFIRGEWTLEAPTILILHIIAFFLISEGTLPAFVGLDAFHGPAFAFTVFLHYLAGLTVSICIYRLCFHRLSGFPGPWLARISKLWHVYMNRGSQNHLLLEKLRAQYGDFVRTGPTEITVFHPEIFEKINRPGSACTKADWYNIMHPNLLINTVRDEKAHTQIRKLWDHAFTSQGLVALLARSNVTAEPSLALASYKERTLLYAKRLENQVAGHTGQVLNISRLAYQFSFDLMGDFAFGRSIEDSEQQEWRQAIVALKKGMAMLGPWSPVPWLIRLGFTLFPFVDPIRSFNRELDWCKDCMKERLQRTVNKPDISHYLIEGALQNGASLDDRHWQGDAVAMIIAGSDTVAPTIIMLLYMLAANPLEQTKLRQELKTVGCPYEPELLRPLNYLNGCIEETLRLFPPVPTGGYRETGPEGLTVGRTHIPAHTTVVAPRYSLGRLESCYEKPHDFVPERWYSSPEMIRDRKGHDPFNRGRYSCVGKQLALTEVRLVLALLVARFVLRLSDDTGGSNVLKEMRDYFTAQPGTLELIFEEI